MTEHDVLCYAHAYPLQSPICICDRLERARADERTKADRERKREVEATAKWCREDERDAIANTLADLGYEEASFLVRDGGSDG